MTLHFDLKKPWTDLVESKENLKYLLGIGILLIVLGIIDIVLKVKIFSSIGNLILGGYFVLMINNIIHDKKPILENLGTPVGEERNLALIILKTLGIGIVYGFGLVILGVILFFLFLKVVLLSMPLAITALIICLMPLLVLISLCNLLFAENLKFSDAFNLKKAAISFGIAWKEYLLAFILNILFLIVAIILLVLVAIPLGFIIALLFKSLTLVPNSNEIAKLFGGMFGATIGQIGAIIISYWYLNIVTQAYKYSLSKMNITEN